MKIALIQTNIVWESPEENRTCIENTINATKQHIDLWVLPEMFTTGFSNNVDLAETMEGKTVQWMQNIAEKHNAAIVGSVMIEENNSYFNRLLFVFPDHKIEFYNKRHLFGYGGEDKVFTRGNERLIVDYLGWKICTLVCYDLRFPVFSRNTMAYDILLYVANWPNQRKLAWNSLLRARAIENMAYCIGVNRIGFDAKKLKYSGESQAFDGLGASLFDTHHNQAVFVFEVNKMELTNNQKQFGFLSDADDFSLIP